MAENDVNMQQQLVRIFFKKALLKLGSWDFVLFFEG